MILAALLALSLSGQPEPLPEGTVRGPDGLPCSPQMQVCDSDRDPRTGRRIRYPADVMRYQELVEGCIHWGGEYAENDRDRQRQIARGVRQTCDVARPMGARLARRYARNAQVLRRMRAIRALFRTIDS